MGNKTGGRANARSIRRVGRASNQTCGQAGKRAAIVGGLAMTAWTTIPIPTATKGRRPKSAGDRHNIGIVMAIRPVLSWPIYRWASVCVSSSANYVQYDDYERLNDVHADEGVNNRRVIQPAGGQTNKGVFGDAPF